MIEIGYWAFRDCSKLKEVLLPKNLKRIESLTFAGCSQLEAIEIPEGCVAILDNAFRVVPIWFMCRFRPL